MQTHYERLGGDAGIRQLVDRFYHHMDTLEEAGTIRAMHPRDLSSSNDKLYKFLSGWSGGPQLYVQQWGHPRLRMRHFPFKIDKAGADAWMLCMSMAIDECIEDPNDRAFFLQAFQRVADHMVNQ